MTNILFCYWLQGYFEITSKPFLEVTHIKKIQTQILNIKEQLSSEVQWINNVCNYLEEMDYKEETLNHFMPLIQFSLNSMFYHYIDNSKDIDYTIDEFQRLHKERAE
ncbi:hypothetical protein [Legionella fallonii]|uniref:Uncharacterized protein n=1 Tax=Legionella fallonii LLAP-10 TaxID=1212491 RepID=A0A098G0B6_9GAMM|nr:hypothetical protein [Legionella fallonii]CEG55947.1 protein of unknown function [Legionella fallonii LLAP-10]